MRNPSCASRCCALPPGGPALCRFYCNLVPIRQWESSKLWFCQLLRVQKIGGVTPRSPFLSGHISPEKTMHIGPSRPNTIGYQTEFPQQLHLCSEFCWSSMCSKQYYSLRNIARLITFKEVMLGESHCSWGVINDNHLAGVKTWDIPEPVLMTLFPEARNKQRMALPGLPETLKKGTHLCNHIHTSLHQLLRQPSTIDIGMRWAERIDLFAFLLCRGILAAWRSLSLIYLI